MAKIYAGGSRRSANPTYAPFRPAASVADNALEQQLYQGIAANTATTVAAPRMSEAIGAGTLTTNGSGDYGISFGGTPASPQLAGDARTIGGIISSLGALSGNANLGQAGGVVRMAGALGEAKSPQQALGVMAGPALSLLGVPGGAVSLGRAAVNGDASLAINSLIGLANPTIGVLNGLASLFGLPTIGEVFSGRAGNSSNGNFGHRGPGGSSGDTAAAEQGASPFGPGLGNGNDGRGYSSQGGSFGGYGGGIGQSGGNAAGMGSAQA